MILPTKGVEPRKALLSVGAVVLRHLDEPKTVSRLWNDVRSGTENPPGFTFDWFVLALDLLFAMGAIDQSGGQIGRRTAEAGDQP